MRIAWGIWLATVVLLTAYCQLAAFVSRPTAISVVLDPGQTATKDVYRIVGPSTLSMELRFDEATARRIQQRDSGSYKLLDADGQVIFDHLSKRGVYRRYIAPGPTVRLTVATPGNAPVTLDSFPHSMAARWLSSNLYVEPGLVRTQPDKVAWIALPSGTTPVRVEILSVDTQLLGTQVTLLVHPLLDFKSADSRVSWLYWAFFWPFFTPVIVVWLLIQVAYTIWQLS